jgi:minor extracellular serine protease Vpr
MRTVFRSPLLAFVVAAGCTGGNPMDNNAVAQLASSPNNNDVSPTGPRVDNTRALVQLYGDPLSTYVKTKPAQGKKIDFDNSTVKSYRAYLSGLRNDFKAWLHANAPTAKVTGEYDISLNAVAVQLNSETLAKIQSSPLVQHAEYEGIYYPTIEDPDLAIIQAKDAWTLGTGGPANAGAGVRVAVLDTGIDVTHPCFSDAGYSQAQQTGDLRFTNNKVIVAKVFNNKQPSRGYTAEALQEHGTHVSGTIACNANTPAVVDGVTIPYGVSGVAPRALLGNYNIFPGDVGNARSEDILDALDAAYGDGFDVANMSLGGGASGIQDLLTIAVDDLDQANMVVAVAAGNSGPGHYTVESPGSAARALTAGASTVNHFIGAPVTVGGQSYGGAVGAFATVSSDLTAPLSASLGTACTAITTDLGGQIALINRGTCTFSTKIRNAQTAHAVAVLVANNVAGNPIAMGQDGTPGQPTIPAYMVDRSTGTILAGLAGAQTTIGATLTYFLTDIASRDIMAGFSSQGPTDVDFRVKPDAVAPGVNVLSSIPHQFCVNPPCWAFFQGTSMATPHLAGSAALVRWIHPAWSAAEVRSAVVNTAERGVLKDFSGALPANDVNIVGAGRENVYWAGQAQAALDPVSVSFGAVPSGSGKTWTKQVVIKNLGVGSATWALSVSGASASDVHYSVNSASVTLASGESATVTVTMAADQGAKVGDYQAYLEVGSVAHAALYTLIK